MNMSIDPVGFSSVNHPMKNPAIGLKISGENHWLFLITQLDV
jgi:hypothetical protein